MAKRAERGGAFIRTATRDDARPASYIGSKFPELGPIPAPRDDCDPPLIVCGRCAVCEAAAARALAGFALASTAFQQEGGPEAEHVDRAGALHIALQMLGIIKDDKEVA